MAEIELKLAISLPDIDTVAASGLFAEPAGTIEQHSIYYDTDDHRLFDAGFTLRIRKSGEARIQTVKATGAGASLFARSEWEMPVTADMPVLDHTSPLLNEFGSIDRDLSRQFEVSTERRTWNLNQNASQIEAVIDQGLVVGGERQTPVCEIELELKDGDPRDLFVLARRIEAIVPIKFEVQSKAERGYRLLETVRTVVKAEPIELDRQMNSAEGFQTIVQSCFRQLRLNETILLRRRNAEALHQVRVAMRRLRSAFSLFKPVLDGEARRISGEFRWLAGILGEARNLDVLLLKATSSNLRDKLEQARTAAYDDVVEALGSARASALMLDFNEWLQCGEYLREQANGKPAAEFAAEALDRMRKKLKKHGRRLAKVDDDQRHEARKDAKKLRYAAEFFGSLFSDRHGGRRYKRFVKAMEELQDHLGALNDLATGPSVLDRHGLRGHPDAESLLSHADKDLLMKDAQAALDEVLDAKKFWR